MENRNLQWNKRVKVPLILIFSVNTNHESVAYRSFSPSKFEARGARKVTTGMRGCATALRPTTSQAVVSCYGLVLVFPAAWEYYWATHLDAGNSCHVYGTKGQQ